MTDRLPERLPERRPSSPGPGWPLTLRARRAAAAGLAGLAGLVATAGPAQAGLVSGEWDPLFGPFLPDLSYAVRADFLVPDSCGALADGTYSISHPACAGATVLNAWLRLYDTYIGDPNDFFGPTGGYYDYASGGMAVTDIRVLDNLVVGVATTTPPISVTFVGVTSALDNTFEFAMTTTGPRVTCFACSPRGYPQGVFEEAPDVVAGISGLTQLLVTYNDDGSARRTDGRGNALGVRLDENGDFVGLEVVPPRPGIGTGTGNGTGSVPEPGALALALAALAAMATVTGTHRARQRG